MAIIGIVIAIVAAIAAILGAIFAGVQAAAARGDRRDAEAARNESKAARDESVELAKQANIEARRRVEAEERANMLREQAIERPHPKFTVERVRNSRWRAANVGNAPLYSAVVEGVAGLEDLIRPDETEPRQVDPGDALMFLALETDQSPPLRIVVRGVVDMGAGVGRYSLELGLPI